MLSYTGIYHSLVECRFTCMSNALIYYSSPEDSTPLILYVLQMLRVEQAADKLSTRLGTALVNIEGSAMNRLVY